ncbi:MAG: outer membrane beta-barrel domain-containing protein [Verrucomicrobiales bacterium]|nr:outer membrane beta-barrel domain-containing protein [Myxococcales bacterium]MCB9521887.1 outer membrane beta-barrel domain-containing protein [Myxococcales bacterium]MCP5515704.1 outer membrane beta-barrel domain-containing protein [Verrucomicrobiales bacterium]
MNRRAWTALGVLCFAWGLLSPAYAQDMDFSPEDMQGGGDDGGAMTFDVVDTAAAAKDLEKARKAEIDLIRVVQRRPFLRRGRVEFAPFMGTNINDAMVSMFVAGANLTYHLTEDMAIGVNGGYSLGTETDLFNKVIEDYALLPQISQVLWYATLDFQYAPVYGKFALFNTWIIPWDLYVLLGAGYTQTELAGNPTLAVGAGQRFFMNQWFTLNFELRDSLYLEEYPGGSEIVNNMMFTAGVSFFIPPSFEYRTLK